MERLLATYRLAVEPRTAERRARELALEQTVELPVEALRRLPVETAGEVVELGPDPQGGCRAVIAYPLESTALDPGQLLNVLFGNASLQPDVALVDARFPEALRKALGGPSFGIAGIRRAAGVGDRPLTCAALKPMGLPPAALGELCGTFARAGIDVVKDDHGLADHAFCPLEARAEACAGAVERAAAETGRRAVYAPSLIGGPSAVERQLEAAVNLGVGAVVVAPMVLGLPAFRELAARSPVPILAHPALAGAPRIELPLLLGSLFRLYGADAVIFPHAGGRFDLGADACGELADRMRRPSGGILPTLPVPAGGMSKERVRELVAFYGADAMLLVGGTLYAAGPESVADRTREFVARVRQAAQEVSSESGARGSRDAVDRRPAPASPGAP